MSSGSKYFRNIRDIKGRECIVLDGDKKETAVIDVYCVLRAFGVTEPATQHAIKKLLCAGLRGKGDVKQVLKEAIDAINAAIDAGNEK